MSGNEFYSSINLKIFAPNSCKIKSAHGKFECQSDEDRFSSCLWLWINCDCQVECENDCNCGEACWNQWIAKKEVKEAFVFETKDKELGAKIEEDFFKDDWINEDVGWVVHKEIAPALFDAYGHERMLHIMSLDSETCLDSRCFGRLARPIDHSCNPNCHV